MDGATPRIRRVRRRPAPVAVRDRCARRLPPSRPDARALDVACGRGRHALLLAGCGYHVLAVDWAVPALQAVRSQATRRGLPMACLAVDLSTWAPPSARYDVVLSTNFLDRACLPRLCDAVRPGGTLVLETFLEGQQDYGHPSNPDYLLQRGELLALCDGWDVLATHEGLTRRRTGDTGRHDAAMMAGIVARRPSAAIAGRV